MYKIVEKRVLNPEVKMMKVEAPLIAAKAKPGQFIILRVDSKAERIPLTIAETIKEEGLVTIIFQEVGASTMKLGALNEGDHIMDFAGPLGKPSELEGLEKVCVIGGGLGCAIAWPQARYLYENGAKVDIITGFRNKDLVIIEEEMRQCSDRLFMMTDDGSYGEKGLVTAKLNELLEAGVRYDAVIAIGPLAMMKFVAQTTKPYGVKTIVSMNPIMIDGTGMCGGCRVTVGGEVKFACVDGPDFDGHQVDFDEAIRRSAMYRENERKAAVAHNCRLGGGAMNA
ncbi:MAG: sulfide/dihydroorotate dehydrogenase-like FAD/NAD-binding protein [Eubacteriales bacterium]|jgi:ferredoxin--NADP+ reductase